MWCNSNISWLIRCARREFIVINCCTLEYIIVFKSNISSLSNNERKVDFKRRTCIQTKNKNKNQNNKTKNKTKTKNKQTKQAKNKIKKHQKQNKIWHMKNLKVPKG